MIDYPQELGHGIVLLDEENVGIRARLAWPSMKGADTFTCVVDHPACDILAPFFTDGFSAFVYLDPMPRDIEKMEPEERKRTAAILRKAADLWDGEWERLPYDH